LFFPKIQFSGFWNALNRDTVASFAGRDLGADGTCPGSPCELAMDQADADFVVVTAHAVSEEILFAKDSGLEHPEDASLIFGVQGETIVVAPKQSLMLVCGEPWCSTWAAQPLHARHPRVGRTVGFSREFDFWWPIGCREWLWFADRGEEGLAGPRSAGRESPARARDPPPRAGSQSLSAAAVFVSNCDAQDRMEFLRSLSARVETDSFGACLHNRDVEELEAALAQRRSLPRGAEPSSSVPPESAQRASYPEFSAAHADVDLEGTFEARLLVLLRQPSLAFLTRCSCPAPEQIDETPGSFRARSQKTPFARPTPFPAHAAAGSYFPRPRDSAARRPDRPRQTPATQT
jgi:hypothetical protein